MTAGCRGYRRDRGFTLLELLIVLSVVSLLISLLWPGLGKLRDNACQTASLSNLRMHGMNMTAYTADYNETYLQFIDPDATYGVIRWNQFRKRILYFEQTLYWNFGMRDYYGGNPFDQSMFIPCYRPTNRDFIAGPEDGPNQYYYSATFLADPRYWRMTTREGRHQWRAIRTSEVRAPSNKGIFIAGNPFPVYRVGKSPIAFVDGHADAVPVSSLTRPVVRGNGQYSGGGFPVLHTPDGVRGMDVK